MIRLADPWLLCLLLLLPLLWWRPRSCRPAPIAFGAAWWALAAGRSARQRLLLTLPTLRSIAFALLVLAAARPQWGTGQVITQTQGVAIIAAIDRSSSMLSPMPTPRGPRTRFEVAQDMFQAFVLGDDSPDSTLRGRPNDLIGLVPFARFAETACPLVLDHATLASIAADLQPAIPESPEDGTAIGDALALAAARLERAERDLLEQRQRGRHTATDPSINQPPPAADYQIKSKAIILLTDGNETAGKIAALDAAELCARLGIRVYAIAIGAFELLRTPNGQLIRRPSARFDQRIPQQIAEITGGRYWSADDAEALRRVYAEIDALETSEIRSIEFTNYDERFPIPALLAAILLAAEFLLARTILRSEPA